MKKLIALLAVIGYVPFAHAAEGDWTHSGEYRLQYNNETNATDFSDTTEDHEQSIHQRTRLNTTVRAGEKMTFNLGLVHNADWGSNTTQFPGDSSVTAAPGTASTNNLLTVQEAYAVWQASDEMTIKAGRASVSLGDGSVVSSNDYLNVPKSYDGAALVYDLDAVRLTGFGVRGANSSIGEKDEFASFYGISADLKTLPSFLKMVNFHYMLVKRSLTSYNVGGNSVPLDAEDASRIGLTAAGDVAGFDYRATYALYKGKTKDNADASTDIDASMIDAEVGYSMPAMMNFRVHAGYHTDSGQDSGTDNTHYSPFHYNQHENAGLMDIVGWGNLTYTRAGVAISPIEDLTVAAEYLMFTKTEKTDGIYGSSGSAMIDGGTATVGGDEDIGNELDVTVTKKYTNNFAIQARYGMFAPGKGIKDTLGDDDTVTQYYLEGKLTF